MWSEELGVRSLIFSVGRNSSRREIYIQMMHKGIMSKQFLRDTLHMVILFSNRSRSEHNNSTLLTPHSTLHFILSFACYFDSISL